MKKGFYSAAAGKVPARGASLPERETRTVAEPPRRAWRDRYKRHERPLLFAAGAALAAGLFAVHVALSPAPLQITQEDIDQAVARTLETKPVPSPAVKAYQAVRSSIVRVRAIGESQEYDQHAPTATGSGVGIFGPGVILTSPHVLARTMTARPPL